MQYLPYARHTFKTTLRIQEVPMKLKDAIEPRQFFRVSNERKRGQKPYEGSVEADAFTAYPVTTYRKSFAPVIRGKVTQEMGGCSITITLRANTALLILMALWVGCTGWAFIASLLRAAPILQMLVSGGMLVCGYGLLNGSYQKEAERSSAFFRGLLDPRYVEEDPIQLFDEE